MMDNSLSLPKKKKLKRLKHQGKLSRIHGASLNKSGRGNLSFNSTFIKQTLRANNRNLAKTLESVRRELKMCQQEKLEAMRETHELREQVRTLERVCGLKNEEIEQEVNLRIAERMSEVKSVILKASQGLQNTVPLLMKGLVLCSGSGRSSSVGSYLSTVESGSRGSTGSRTNSPIEQTESTVANVTSVRRFFGASASVNDKAEESPKAALPVRSAIPSTLLSTRDSEVRSDIMPGSSVRPSDFCNNDLSMIMEQSHLGDLDLDDLDGIGTGRRSSRRRLSRKTKSRGRRSTVHASRSLEMFQQSLVENSPQEESQTTEPGNTSEESETKDEAQKETRSSETTDIETPMNPVVVTGAEVDMETEGEVATSTPQTYECKLNDVDAQENTEGDVNIKSRRTRSRSMKRAKSAGRETRSKSKARKRSASPDSDKEDHKCENSKNEQSTRSSSRMSRRDSYEKTLTQKSAEKSKSSRSMSRRKSKRTTEKEDTNETVTNDNDVLVASTDKEDEKVEKENIPSESVPQRKSSRRKVEKTEESENVNTCMVKDTATEKETDDLKHKQNTHKEDELIKEDDTSKKVASRRKSKRIKEKEAEVDDADSNEPNEKKRTTRKSKRLVVESSMETDDDDSKAELESDQPVSDANFNADELQENMPQPESENETSSASSTEIVALEKAREDKRSKRKSRRATKALFTAEDIDEIMKDTKSTSSESADDERSDETKNANSSKPVNDTKNLEKERRGTFVVNKKPTVIVNDEKNEKTVQKDKTDSKDQKNRRGTFVVPTAPPPAPRPKKTISNIPILEGRSKPAEERETKRNLDRDRRGTYFVPKPVTPYIDVENIEDIEADSILVSLTDDDSQGSMLQSQDKEQEASNKETTVKNSQKTVAPKINIVPRVPSPALQPGEMTVLEPQDMELTEALTVINWSRFSAPEPEFLKKVSPGPKPVAVPANLNTTVTIEKSHDKQEVSSADQSNADVLVAESDPEDEKQQPGRKSTKIKSKAKTANSNAEKKFSKDNSDPGKVTQSDRRNVEPVETQSEAPAVDTDAEVSNKKDVGAVEDHQEKPRRSKKFRLMKASDDTLGPSDTESVTSEVTASESEEQEKRIGDGRRSRRSAKPVKYTESNSDEEEEEQEKPKDTDGNKRKEKISDLLKAKSKQKFQAWLSKPGDIKFTGGKRDVTTQLMEDLTKHQRSKSKDRSTIIPKPRARSRSRSRSRPRIPLPSDDSPKSEFDFVGTPPQDRVKQINKSTPGNRKSSDGLPKTPGQISYSEFRGRTPMRKSVGDQPTGCLNPVTVPLEPKKTNCPEEEEFTVHDHGIMLLLGNGRRTKPRTKGKSVCMAPEKSNVHLITPMVGKTQAMPRTPPPHGEAPVEVDDTPPSANVVLKSPPPLTSTSTATFKHPTDLPKPISATQNKTQVTNREPVISIPESPMVSPENPARISSTKACSLEVTKRSKSSDKYFGFEIDDDDSVFQTESPSVLDPPVKDVNKVKTDLPQVTLGGKKKSGILSRKSLMEGKPKTDSQTSQSDSSSCESSQSKAKSPKKSELSKSVKKKKGIRKMESESDGASSPQAVSPVRLKRSERSNKSRSRTQHYSADKENEMSEDSSPDSNLSHKTPGPGKALKTPATKTPAATKSTKSAKGKSTKKATKTPGTAKKAGRVTLTNLKRKLDALRSKTATADDESEDRNDGEFSPNIKTKKSKTNRRLYDDEEDDVAEKMGESTSQKRKCEQVDNSAGVYQDGSSPKRPRRAAAKVACYVEPSLGSKLRQGDPGTSTIYEGGSGEELKSLVRKSKGSSRKRDALHTVTNIKV